MIVIFCIRGTSGGTFTTIMNFSLNSVFSKWGHVLTFTMAYLWGCNLFRKEHHFQKGLNTAICLPVPCLKCWWSKMIFSLCIILLQTVWKQMPWNVQQIFIYWSKNSISMNCDVLNNKGCYRFCLYCFIRSMYVDICSTLTNISITCPIYSAQTSLQLFPWFENVKSPSQVFNCFQNCGALWCTV